MARRRRKATPPRNSFIRFLSTAFLGTLVACVVLAGLAAVGAAAKPATLTATFTPSITLTPSLTFTPSPTLTPTMTLTPSLTLTPTDTFTPSNTFTPTATPTATNTFSKADLAGTRVSGQTATKQAYYDNLTATRAALYVTRTAYVDGQTATASAAAVTRTAYWDAITLTADSIYATRTQQASNYFDTATENALNYVAPVATYPPQTGGSGQATLVPVPTVAPTAVSSGGGGGGPPSGATAICNDGSYSFSKHRRGTCSYHGGVRTWLQNVPP